MGLSHLTFVDFGNTLKRTRPISNHRNILARNIKILGPIRRVHNLPLELFESRNLR